MRFGLHILVAAAITTAACGGGDSTSPTTGGTSTTPQTPSSPSAPVQTNQVAVDNDFFSPANIQVSPGTTVQFTWASGAGLHNVTFSDGGSGDKTGQGALFSKTFATVGTFNYSCTLHGAMTGSVLVK